MGFDEATRQKYIALPPQSRSGSGGNILRWDFPRVGMLARVYLLARGTTNTLTGAPNSQGFSSVIRRVRVIANAGIDAFNMSGPGYHYLLRPFLDFPGDPVPQSNGRSAIASATAYNGDMVIPIAVNLRDAVGLIMLQNEQTLLTLQVETETDANLAGTSLTWTTQPVFTPILEVFTVPQRGEDFPNLNTIHQVLEETQTVSGAGDVTYAVPRGNTYLQIVHGLGQGVAGADGWSHAKLRVNQSDYLVDADPTFFDIVTPMQRYQQRLPGTIPFDLFSSTGLGTYDKLRDVIDSRAVTQLDTVITATGAGTLYTMRRQLISLA